MPTPEDIVTISVADFIARLSEARENHPELADQLAENIEWAMKYDPFTPVILRHDHERGMVIPSVDLSGMAIKSNPGSATEFIPLTPDEETQAAVAHLNTLAQIVNDYELDSGSLIRQLDKELATEDEMTVRSRLDALGLGESARVIKKFRAAITLFNQAIDPD
jgi:hypothetical protein